MRPPRLIESRLADLRRRVPPRCPRGWETAPPDFVGLGAQRAGTTWWYGLLRQHPDVHGPRVKELRFFDRETVTEDPQEVRRRYARYFPRPPGSIAGEWTPNYLSKAHVPAQLHAAVPNARLLVLLRDPVERYRSGVARRGGGRDQNAFRRGLYVRHLRNYLEHFPREQLLVLQYERCLQDPAAELAKTYEFLGVDPAFVPDRFDREGARSFGSQEDLPRELRRELRREYRPQVRRLLKLGFDIDPTLWPNFTQLARLKF